MEDPDPRGKGASWGPGPTRIENHPGLNLKRGSEDSMLLPLPVEGVVLLLLCGWVLWQPWLPSLKGEGERITLDRSAIESTLGDLNKVVQQARLIPNYRDGAVNGFKIFAIREGSLFKKLGLEDGDVIHRINDTEITSVKEAVPMFQLVRTENHFEMELTRGGERRVVTIEIR